MHKINKPAVFALFLILFAFKVSAQLEYLVTVEPDSGNFTKKFLLPDVRWIVTLPHYVVFDEANQRYIFRGTDEAQVKYYLYSVDVNTGQIVSMPEFPILEDPKDVVLELQYDNAAHKLYGLRWDESEQREELIRIDPATGVITVVKVIPLLKSIYNLPNRKTIDKNQHRMFFSGGEFNNKPRLYCIDLNTGNVLNKPLFPVLTNTLDNVTDVQFDNSLNQLFGLHWNTADNSEYLISIDPVTGTFTKLFSLPNVRWSSAIPNCTTYDEINHRLIFMGGDIQGNWYLYSIDVQTGAIVSAPSFPVLEDPLDNVIELQFDNSTGILYALHWDNARTIKVNDPLSQSSQFTIAPNPVSTETTLRLNTAFAETVVYLYNAQGQVVRQWTYDHQTNAVIDCKNLPKGSYFISVIGDHRQIGVQKILVE